MSITPLSNANFTPTMGTYNTPQTFRFWCQKVLPLVYDDSLSYYELLCKVVDYLNKTMEDVNTAVDDVTNLHTAYEQLQEYVNTYFDSLDVQTEINNKLDEMVSDGTFTNLFAPYLQHYQDDLTLLQTQVNNLINSYLPGSTSDDAALNDIKIGYDGTQFDTPANGVRGQIKQTRNDLSVPTKNILQFTKRDILTTHDVTYTPLTTNTVKVETSGASGSAVYTIIGTGTTGFVALPVGQYTLSIKRISGTGDLNIYYTLGGGENKRCGTGSGEVDHRTFTSDGSVNIRLHCTTSTGAINGVFAFQLEAGSVATEIVPAISAVDVNLRDDIDSTLNDANVGYNGIVYDSLGESIRGQINDVVSEITEGTKNLAKFSNSNPLETHNVTFTPLTLNTIQVETSGADGPAVFPVMGENTSDYVDLPIGNYTLSIKRISGTGDLNIYYYTGGGEYNRCGTGSGEVDHRTFTSDGSVNIRLHCTDSTGAINGVFAFQLEAGSVATEIVPAISAVDVNLREEVLSGTTGYDGTTYPSIKSAINSQIEYIRNDITEDTENILKFTTRTVKKTHNVIYTPIDANKIHVETEGASGPAVYDIMGTETNKQALPVGYYTVKIKKISGTGNLNLYYTLNDNVNHRISTSENEPSFETFVSDGYISVRLHCTSGTGEIDGVFEFQMTNTSYEKDIINAITAIDITSRENNLFNFINSKYSMNAISHRGCGNTNLDAPENTIPGFIYAIKNGFREIETDVRYTSDNVPVLIHDESINRTARYPNGGIISDTIYVADCTYEELLQYDFGIVAGAKYAGTKIPTLDEALRFFKRCGIKMYLELKATQTNEIDNILVSLARKYHMENKIAWLSFTVNRLIRIAAILKKGQYVINVNNTEEFANTLQTSIDSIKNITDFSGEIEVCVNSHNANPIASIMNICKTNGLKMYCGAITMKATAPNIDPYIDGILSNKYNPNIILLNEELS